MQAFQYHPITMCHVFAFSVQCATASPPRTYWNYFQTIWNHANFLSCCHTWKRPQD